MQPGPQVIPVQRPDGDVELQDAGKGFIVPPCDNCGGVLKPYVVFFGVGGMQKACACSVAICGASFIANPVICPLFVTGVVVLLS